MFPLDPHKVSRTDFVNPRTFITLEEFIFKVVSDPNRGFRMSRRLMAGIFIIMPCNCGDNGCFGWSIVRNDADSVNNHLDLTLMRMGHDSRLQPIGDFT